MLGFIRTTMFLGFLCAGLASLAMAAGVAALQAGVQVATLTTQVSQHRDDLKRAVAKTKAKARLRRSIIAVPVLGVVAVGFFEERDYRDWQDDNPGRSAGDYSCEMASLTAEVVDEVLFDLPTAMRPGPDTVKGWMPDCQAVKP